MKLGTGYLRWSIELAAGRGKFERPGVDLKRLSLRDQDRLSRKAKRGRRKYNIEETQEGSSDAAAKLLQSCPTLCNPIDGSPPGSPIPAVLQARTLEWVMISRGK